MTHVEDFLAAVTGPTGPPNVFDLRTGACSEIDINISEIPTPMVHLVVPLVVLV